MWLVVYSDFVGDEETMDRKPMGLYILAVNLYL